MNKTVRLRSTRRAEKARHPASPSSFSPATVGKRRCRGALHNCGDSAWDLADRASVVECDARAPLCLGLRPTIHKVSTEMRDLRPRFFAGSLSARRYGVLRMTGLKGLIIKGTNGLHAGLGGG